MARWTEERLKRYDVLKDIRNRILYEAYWASQMFHVKCLACGRLFTTSEPAKKLYCRKDCGKRHYEKDRYAMKMKKGAKSGGQQKSGSGIPAPTKNNAGSAQGIMRKRS